MIIDLLKILWLTLSASMFIISLTGSIVRKSQHKEHSARVWATVSVVSVLALCGFVLFAVKNPSTHSTNKQTTVKKIDAQPTEIIKETPINTNVSFADIYKAFKRNELVAKETYNGNRYRITAKINNMDTGGLKILWGGGNAYYGIPCRQYDCFL